MMNMRILSENWLGTRYILLRVLIGWKVKTALPLHIKQKNNENPVLRANDEIGDGGLILWLTL